MRRRRLTRLCPAPTLGASKIARGLMGLGETELFAERESAGYLVGETTHLLRADAGLAVAAVAVSTALGFAADLYPGVGPLIGLGSFVANLFFQYEISLALLVHYGLLEDRSRRRRIWALLGLNLLSGIGIIFGLLLLIGPGAYLMVRWSASAPALIAEDSDVTGSWGLSAQAVEGRFWHVMAALLVVWSPAVACMVASPLAPEEQPLWSLILNLSSNLSLVAGWHLAVAIYAGRQTGNRLAEVFA